MLSDATGQTVTTTATTTTAPIQSALVIKRPVLYAAFTARASCAIKQHGHQHGRGETEEQGAVNDYVEQRGDHEEAKINPESLRARLQVHAATCHSQGLLRVRPPEATTERRVQACV